METVGHVIQHVSGQLSDQQKRREYTRWPRLVMLEYLNQGMKEVAAYRPDAFSASREVELRPGARQAIPTTGEITGVRVAGTALAETDAGILRAFSTYSECSASPKLVRGKAVYKARTFSVDPQAKGEFAVSPAVPAGIRVAAEVVISGEAPEYTLADWNRPLAIQDKYYNNLIDYMMARAYKRDSESQVSQAQSQRLFQLFYSAMGQKYKIDSAFNSGYYKGEVGTGDPRSAV